MVVGDVVADDLGVGAVEGDAGEDAAAASGPIACYRFRRRGVFTKDDIRNVSLEVVVLNNDALGTCTVDAEGVVGQRVARDDRVTALGQQDTGPSRPPEFDKIVTPNLIARDDGTVGR